MQGGGSLTSRGLCCPPLSKPLETGVPKLTAGREAWLPDKTYSIIGLGNIVKAHGKEYILLKLYSLEDSTL